MRLKRIIEPEYAGVFYRKERYAHDPELMEAYRCGKKDGWREAMEEADGYHERRGNVTHYGAGGRILYRDDDDMYDDDEVAYRRRRDSMGRFR